MKLVLTDKEYNKIMGIISSISDGDIMEVAKNNPFLISINTKDTNRNIEIDIATEYVEELYGEIELWTEPIFTALKSLSSMIRLACRSITKKEADVILKLREKYEKENKKNKKEISPSEEAINKIAKINLDKF